MRLNSAAKTAVFKVFVDAIKGLSVIEQTVRPNGEAIRVSQSNPYPTTRPTVTATKTVFDKVPCDSDLERDFAQWLDSAEDVLAFRQERNGRGLRHGVHQREGRPAQLPSRLPCAHSFE